MAVRRANAVGKGWAVATAFLGSTGIVLPPATNPTVSNTLGTSTLTGSTVQGLSALVAQLDALNAAAAAHLTNMGV